MGKYWTTDSSGKRKRTAAGYKHEYEKFQSSAKQIAQRSARNSARREALKSGKVSKGDGKDVDHVNSNPTDNSSDNLRVVSASTNRGKSENSRKRGSKRNRSMWGE